MSYKTPKTPKHPPQQWSSSRTKTQKSTVMFKHSPSTLRTKTLQQQSAQSSLIIKLIEAQVSSQDQYQNLLIKNKQLEIGILQLEQESQTLKKSYKKASRPLEEIKAKIESAKLSLTQKQKYLQKFYTHLDNKLKTNMNSNLFGKLQKIQSTLQQKYEQQKQILYSGLASQHENMQVANKKLAKLKQHRDQLIKQYTQRAMDSSSRNMSHPSEFNKSTDHKFNKNGSEKKSQNKSAHHTSSKKSHLQKLSQKNQQKDSLKRIQQLEKRKRKQQKQLAKMQTINQCEKLRQNIIKLKSMKQMAQKDEKLLKQLLNIEEQHKKHSGYIISGYKKMFAIQYRQMLSSRKRYSNMVRKQSPENTIKKSQENQLRKSQKSELQQSYMSMPDVQGMQRSLNQKVAEKQVLQREVKERNAMLEECKEKLNEEIAVYSRLEEQIMSISNKNASRSNSDNEPNFRMTYAESQNAGQSRENYRSTYTSYQQRSDHLDEDL